jgi:hypothetical protein
MSVFQDQRFDRLRMVEKCRRTLSCYNNGMRECLFQGIKTRDVITVGMGDDQIVRPYA